MAYKVTIENIAYHDNSEIDAFELSEERIDELNALAKKKKLLKKPVLKVLGGHLAFDDNQGKTEIKTFVSIDILVDTDDEDEAENIEIPEDLLELAAEFLAEDCGETLACDDAWEILQTEEAED